MYLSVASRKPPQSRPVESRGLPPDYCTVRGVTTMSNQRRRRLLVTMVFAGTSLLHDVHVEAFTPSPFHCPLQIERHDATTATSTAITSSLPSLHVPKAIHLTLLLKADTSEESPPQPSLEEGSILGASLLFAGTAVGAGMLALPAETLESGFIPTLSGLIICWVFTYVTSLATLEASWTALQLASADVVDKSSSSEASGGTGGGTSFLSISRRALGVPGEVVTGLLFWFLLTAIVVAYTAEGGQLIAQFVDEISSSSIQVAPAIGSAVRICHIFWYIGNIWDISHRCHKPSIRAGLGINLCGLGGIRTASNRGIESYQPK